MSRHIISTVEGVERHYQYNRGCAVMSRDIISTAEGVQ